MHVAMHLKQPTRKHRTDSP